MKKRTLLIIIFLILLVCAYVFFNNYNRNNVNGLSYKSYSNYDLEFFVSVKNSQIEANQMDKILEEISKKKFEMIESFLESNEQRINFSINDIDTLIIKKDKKSSYSITSTLNKGKLDSDFQILAFNQLTNYMKQKDFIEEIQLYTYAPTEVPENMPIPLGPYTNVKDSLSNNDDGSR